MTSISCSRLTRPFSSTGASGSGIPTPHGDVTIKLTRQRYAVRNPYHPALIEIVKAIFKGRGRWNAQYKNWLIGKDDIYGVAGDISAAVTSV